MASEPYDWTCPHCGRDVTISEERDSTSWHELDIDNADGGHFLHTQYAVCPNKKCRKFTLTAMLFKDSPIYRGKRRHVRSWRLVPPSDAKSFPDYIPETIRTDYEEACLIKDLSPKASATLARRCLQGIIRDFLKVKKNRLVDEIEAIEDKVDPLTWEAIDSVRKVGNIGAHMEKDVNVIVDVEPKEAQLLIELIETLFKEWYVQREERRVRLEEIKKVAESKEELRQGKKEEEEPAGG